MTYTICKLEFVEDISILFYSKHPFSHFVVSKLSILNIVDTHAIADHDTCMGVINTT